MVGNGQIRLLPVDGNVVVERIIDSVPDVLDKISGMFKKKQDKHKDVIIVPDEH